MNNNLSTNILINGNFDLNASKVLQCAMSLVPCYSGDTLIYPWTIKASQAPQPLKQPIYISFFDNSTGQAFQTTRVSLSLSTSINGNAPYLEPIEISQSVATDTDSRYNLTFAIKLASSCNKGDKSGVYVRQNNQIESERVFDISTSPFMNNWFRVFYSFTAKTNLTVLSIGDRNSSRSTPSCFVIVANVQLAKVNLTESASINTYTQEDIMPPGNSVVNASNNLILNGGFEDSLSPICLSPANTKTTYKNDDEINSCVTYQVNAISPWVLTSAYADNRNFEKITLEAFPDTNDMAFSFNNQSSLTNEVSIGQTVNTTLGTFYNLTFSIRCVFNSLCLKEKPCPVYTRFNSNTNKTFLIPVETSKPILWKTVTIIFQANTSSTFIEFGKNVKRGELGAYCYPLVDNIFLSKSNATYEQLIVPILPTATIPSIQSTQEPQATEAPLILSPATRKISNGLIIGIVVIVVAIALALIYYFKVKKDRQNADGDEVNSWHPSSFFGRTWSTKRTLGGSDYTEGLETEGGLSRQPTFRSFASRLRMNSIRRGANVNSIVGDQQSQNQNRASILYASHVNQSMRVSVAEPISISEQEKNKPVEEK